MAATATTTARLAACVWLLVAILLLAEFAPVAEAARNKRNTRRGRNSRKVRSRQKECLRTACKGTEETDPNCVYKCMSMICFERVFGGNELEPGEVDTAREKDFFTCFRELP